MREKEEKLIITFHTTSAAIAMEKHCKANGLPGRLIPVPRSITSDCGMAWASRGFRNLPGFMKCCFKVTRCRI